MRNDSRSDGDRTDTRAPKRDGGFTLPEVVVAIAVTGTLVLATVLGAFALVRASATSDTQADVEAVLGAAADKLQVAGWQECPATSTTSYELVAQQAAQRVDWPDDTITIAPTDIQYWDISTKDWSATNPFDGPGGCTDTPTIAAASRMQLVTIHVAAPGGRQERSIDVVVAEIDFLDVQESP